MKRFARKRRSGGDGGARTLDASEWLPKILEAGLVEATGLEPWPGADVPDTVAVIGRGERSDGSKLLVSFSPHSASEAILAGLAAAQKAVAEDGFAGTLYVVAPQWPTGARRLLALLGQAPYQLEPVVAAALAEGRVVVEPEPEPSVMATGAAQLAARLTAPEARAAFSRAALALEGLAAKHGGAVRAGLDRLELVVLARRVAELRIEGDAARLEVQLGGRTSTPLSGVDLAGALDGLEGQIRRRLNDRKVREGEEGLRGRVVSQLGATTELRGLRPWPLPGNDLDAVDGVGLDAEGRPVLLAVREEFGFAALAEVLESVPAVRGLVPTLFADAAPPLLLGTPKLWLAAAQFVEGLERALSAFVIAFELRGVASAAGPALDLVAKASGAGADARPARRSRRRGGRGNRGAGPAADEEGEVERSVENGAARAEAEAGGEGRGRGSEAENDENGRGRGRRRRRSRRGGRGGNAEAGNAEGGDAEARPREAQDTRAARDTGSGDASGAAEGGKRRSRRFEEVSLMDLDDGPEPGGDGQTGSSERSDGKRRRGRRRGRGGRGDEGNGADSGDSSDSGEAENPTAARVEEDDLVDSDDLEEILARLAEEGDDFDESEPSDPAYEDDEEIGDEETAAKRTPARKAAATSEEDSRPAPRRRSALLVHADRDSIFSAWLLARDIRQLDGVWVYPQEELMTFFRSVATDLRDDTPIFMVGFHPRPARDVIQAASLYRGRLTWFDRHDWPPEDKQALIESIGRDAVFGGEQLDSTLPRVLETCSRRSRFSDKLVDLATGRFTQHDFERWGRLWWWRVGEIARKTGDIRADLAPILSGRPSDLAKEAASLEMPPPPDEVAWVAERDFRLVHFGGHVLVVVPVEEPNHLHLVARIARERYGASLSLAYRPGEEVFVLTGDEGTGKRALDYMAVAEHLVNKLEWVEACSDADHMSRFRARDLDRRPERLEELIGEIAMGRSLLER